MLFCHAAKCTLEQAATHAHTPRSLFTSLLAVTTRNVFRVSITQMPCWPTNSGALHRTTGASVYEHNTDNGLRLLRSNNLASSSRESRRATESRQKLWRCCATKNESMKHTGQIRVRCGFRVQRRNVLAPQLVEWQNALVRELGANFDRWPGGLWQRQQSRTRVLTDATCSVRASYVGALLAGTDTRAARQTCVS